MDFLDLMDLDKLYMTLPRLWASARSVLNFLTSIKSKKSKKYASMFFEDSFSIFEIF